MQKATINKNAMTRPIASAARVVLTSVNIFEHKSIILANTIPHTVNTNPARAAPIHPITKTFDHPSPKVLHGFDYFCFLFHQPLRASLFAELVASYHQLSPISQVEV